VVACNHLAFDLPLRVHDFFDEPCAYTCRHSLLGSSLRQRRLGKEGLVGFRMWPRTCGSSNVVTTSQAKVLAILNSPREPHAPPRADIFAVNWKIGTWIILATSPLQ